MMHTPGIEVNASATIEGDASITHTVQADGTTEIEFGGHTSLHLCLSQHALRSLHTATTAAVKEVEKIDSPAA